METVTKRTQDITMQILAWIFTRFSMIVSRLSSVVIRPTTNDQRPTTRPGFVSRLSFVVLRPTTNEQRTTTTGIRRIYSVLFACALLLGSMQGWGQNALNSGDFSGGTWGTAQNMSASAGGSLIITKGVTTTGDKFFRFYGDGSPCGEYQPNANGDLFTHNTVVTSPNANCGSSNAWKINVPTTASNVVFKTDGGNDGMDRSIAFVIRGTVRTISTVSISPAAPASSQSATVTASMSGGLATGHGVYLRYTTNDFVSSTILSMTNSTANNYTATIPAQPTGKVVKYYVFTSGNGLTISHADADFYTINLNNNSGSNYSYTSAAVTRYAVASGNWNATSTWSTTSGGAADATVPAAGDVVIIERGNTVTVTESTSVGTLSFGSSAQNVGNLVVNSGVTLTVTGSTSVDPRTGANSQSATISGAGTLNLNSLTVGSTAQAPSGTQTITLTSTIAAMNISGNLTLTSDYATNSSNVYISRFYLNEGTVTIDGVITPSVLSIAGDVYFRMDQGNQTGTLVLKNAAPWGTDIDLQAPWGSGSTSQLFLFLNGTNSTVTYSAAGNQTINRARYAATGTVAVTYTNLTLAGSGNKDLPSTSTATVNGTLSIQGTATLTTSSPTYGASSTLRYFTGQNYNRGLEWTTATSGAGYPNNVQISNPGTVTTLNMGATSARCAGNLTLDVSNNITTATEGLTVVGNIIFNGGYTLGGDINAGGDYTVGASATVNNNNKAVFFNKATGNQTITKTGGGIVYFDYLVINKLTSGNVVLGTSTNVEINTTTGSVLQINNSGGLDLNGNTFTLNGTNGNILVSGGARNITSASAGANFIIGGNKAVTSNTSGTLIFGSNVNVKLNAGLNFGAGLSTVNGSLEIGSGGFVDTNAPAYGASSTLIYATGGTYGRSLEWSATSGAGYPANVTINNGSGLDLGNGATSTARQLSGDLTVNGGLYMDFGSNDMTQSLTVLGNVVIGASGQLSLSDAAGGDMNVKGNWTNNGGTFSPKSRAVAFTGTATQTITKTGGETFDYLTVNKSSGNLSLSNDITCNQTLTLTNGDIVTGANKVIVSSTGSVSGGATASHIVGNLQHYFATGSSVAKTYPIGDGTNYSPATITLGSVTTAGTITLSATATAHPNIATFALSATKYINRYWSVTNSSTVFTSGSIAFNYAAGDLQGGAAAANLLGARYTTSSTSWSYPTTTGQAANTFTCTGITNTNIENSYTAGECATPSAPTAGNASKTYTGIANTTSVSATPGAGQTIDWYADATGGSALSSGSTTYIPSGVNAGTYTVYAEARNSSTGCLSATRTAVTLTINKAVLTITAGNQTVTYGTAAATVTGAGTYTATGFVNSETSSVIGGSATYTTTYTATTNAGTAGVTITPVVAALTATNYSFSAANGTITISTAPLTVTASAQSKTFGATAPTSGTLNTNYTVTGLQGTDAASGARLGYSGTPAGNLATAAVGSYTITPSALTLSSGSTSNYSITYSNGTLTVNAAALTVTASAQSKTFGATAPTSGTLNTNYTVTGLQGTDAAGGATLGYSGTPAGNLSTAAVGSYTITPSALSLSSGSISNYSITYATGTLTVNAAALTVTASAQSKTYGGTVSTTGSLNTTFTVTGLQGTDAASGATLGYSGTPAGNLATAAVGSYTITPSALSLSSGSLSNYSITYATGTLTVNAAALTVTASAQSKTYGGTVATAGALGTTFTVSGLQNADAVSGSTLGYSGTPAGNTATASVGSYTITPSALTLSSGSTSNYSITYATGTLTVSAAALTVTASAQTKEYGSTVATAGVLNTTFTVSGLLNSDAANGATLGYSGTPAGNTATAVVGNYTITPSALTLSTGSASNYSITYATGTLTVTQKALTVTGLTGVNKTYDGTTVATATGTAALSGVIAADAANVTLSGTPAFTFSSANVGSAISISTSGYTLTGTRAANYTLTQPTLSANITAKALTVTGLTGINKVYDRTTAATASGTPSLVGVVSGDVVSISGTPTFTFASANVGTAISISTTGYTLTGASAGNYSLTQPTLSANITAKALTVTGLTGANKVYDRTTTATATGTAALSGVISPDAVTLTGTPTFTFASANVGTGISISTTGYTLGGANAANYSLTQPTLSANITAKALTITGVTVASKVYDNTNTATLNTGLATLSGVVSPDVVTLSSGSATGTFASVNAGAGIAVTATGFSLGGAAAANYSVTQPTGLTGTITPRPITLTGTRVYDGTDIALASDVTISNNLDGANLTLTGSGTLDLEDVGARTISNATELSRVQAATGNTGANTQSNFAVTLSSAPTDGNTLVAVISTRSYTQNTVSSITQTGTTWTRATQSTNLLGVTTEIWYAPARSTSGAGVSITLNTSNTRSSAAVMEYRGVLALNPLDDTQNNTNFILTSSNATTGSITTNQANELIIAAIGVDASGVTLSSIQNSFSQVTASESTNGTSGNNARVFALERMVTSTGSYSTGATLSSSRQWAASIASFKASIPSGTAFTLGGSAAGNYTLTGMTGTMTVTAKSLSITAPTIASKEYDGSAASGAVTVGTLSGVVSPETLNVSATGTYANANVGTGKTATIVYTLSDGTNGGKATNYSLANGSATGNITAKALTITANDQSKCQGSTLAFTGSEFTSSGLVSGQSITGATFTSSGAASGAAVGTYTIVPSAATGATISNYTITYVNGTLTVNPSTPATVSITSNDVDNTICPGTSVTFTATPLNAGASPSYQWKLNGANVGTNSTTYTTTSLANGDQVMVVMSYAATSCLAAANTNSNTITTTVNPAPTAFSVTGGGGYCTGGSGVSIGLSGSQSGVTYQLIRGGSTNVGSPVSGTGAAISFGLQTTAGTYTVTASNTTTGCINTMTGSTTVVINTIPTAPQIGVIAQPSCTVTTGSVTLNGLPSSGTWTVTISPGGAQTTGSGTSGTINGLTANNTYTFTVTSAEGCTSSSSLGAVINAWTALPDAPTGTNASRCGTGSVTLFATPPGANQTIDWYTTSTGGTAVSSGSTSYATPSISSTTIYYAETRVTSTGCVSATRTAVTATINSVPTITASSTATSVRYGVTSSSLTYSATSGSPATYSISWNSTPTNNFGAVSDATLTSSPISIAIPTSTAVGTYTGTLSVKSISGCSSTSSNFTLVITAAPLTITGITADNKVYDATTTATSSGTEAYSGLQYGETFTVSGTPVENFNTAAVGNSKAVTVTGYTAPSSNYSITQPSLTANITAAPLTITLDEVYKAVGTTLTTPVSGFADFIATGLVETETIGSITVTYGTGAASNAAAGTYTNTAVPSAATGGTFTASNYSITYVPNNIVVGNYKYAWNTGNWNASNMWSSSSSSYVATSAPTSTDIVLIRRGNTVTVNITTAVCGRIELGGTGANTEGYLTFASSGSPKLTVSGQVVIGGFGSTNTNRQGIVTLVNGATLEAEDILLTRSTAGNDNPGTLSMATGGTLIANTITVGQGTATWTPGTGTVILANTNNVTLPSTAFTSFNNLTINANKTVFSGRSFSVAGTMTVNGIFTPGATSHVVSGAGTLTGSGEIDVTLVSATALTSQFSITNRTLSNMTVEYRGAGNQSMEGTTYGNLVTAGSGTKTLLGTTTVNSNLTIGASSTLSGGGQSLNVKGNWNNNGTFTHASGTVTFNGTGAQVIDGNTNFNNFVVTNSASNISLTSGFTLGVAGTFTPNGTSFGSQAGSVINFNGSSEQTIPAFNFVNLSVNGGGTKTLSGAVTVSNVMTLTSGDVSLGNNNLTLSSASGLSGGSASSHIITAGTGVFRRAIGGAGTYFFPMGSVTDYNPVTYVWTSAPGITQLDASYTTASAALGSGLPTIVFECATATDVLNNGYWNFTPTGTLSGNPSITVGRLGHTNAGPTLNSHGIVRRDNSSSDWQMAGVWANNVNNTAINPANTGNVALTQSALAAFGEIAVAKGTGTGNAYGLWTGAVNGEAENSANWGCGTVPTYTIDVVIPRNTTYQPTIFNSDIQAKSVTINSGAILRITGPRTLSIAANGYFANSGTFNSGNNSTVSFEGAGSVSGQSASSFNNLNLNGATTLTTVPTITGNLQLNTGASVTASPNYGNNAVLVYNMTNTASTGFEWTGNGTSVAAGSPNNISIQGAGTVTLSGNRSVPGTFTLSNGVVAVGNNTLSLYGDVTVASGSFTSGATGTVLYAKESNNQTVPAGNYGNLTLNNFSKVLATSGTIGVAGTFTPGSASHTTTGSTISFNGSSAQSIPAFNYNNVIVAGSNTKTAAAGLTIPGNLTISSTFDAGAFSHAVAGNWINNGTFTHGGGTIQFNGTSAISGSAENTFNNVMITGALTAPNANMNVAGNWSVNGGTFTPGTGTVTLNNTQAPQTISGSASEFSFNNLTVANTGQTISVQGGSPVALKVLNLSGNMTLSSGALSASFTEVNMTGGNWTNNGATFTSGGSRISFTSTAQDQAINGTASTQTFAKLIMNKTGRTLSLGGSTTRLNITDTFALQAGTYNAGTTDSLKIGGNWVITGGAFTPGVSTVAFNGNGEQNIPAQTYHKLSVINGSTKRAIGHVTVNDEMNISSGMELDMDTYQLVDGGTLNTTGSGTLRTKNIGETPLPNGKTWSFAVAFEGAAEQTLSNGTYNGGVTINNSTNGAKMNGNVTAAALTLSSGDLAIQSNTLTLNGSFNGSSNNALRGSVTSNLTVGNAAAAGILYFRNSGTSNFIKDLRFMSTASATLGNRLNVTAGAAAGKVKVEANSSLASNGNLVLKSDTLGTAFVDEIANCTTCTPITGEVEVERAMPNRRTWRLVTIPVTGNYTLRQQLTRQGPGAAVEYPAPYCNGSVAPAATGYGTMITAHSMSSCGNAAAVGADLITTGGSSSVRRYTFLNNSGSWASNNTTNAINFSAVPDQDGYMMFIRGDRSQLGSGSNATTFRFRGTLKQGNALSTQAVNASYGVMSNPYAAPINVDDVFNNGTGNASKFDRNVWVWDGEKVGANGLGGYRSLSYDGVSAYTCGDCGTNAEGQQFLTLNSGQAFMVQRKADVTTAVSMTVKEEDKVSSAGNIATMRTSANARLTNSTVPSFRVQMHRANGASLESFADAATARFNKLYQANANEPYDVYKYNNNDENISLVRDRKYLVIESRPVPTTTDTLYLPFWNATNRGYALSIQTENFSTPGLAAELIDSFTNTRTQVPLNGSTLVYPFSVTTNAASKSLSRFRVVFTQGSSLPVNFVNVRAQVKNGSMVQVDWEVANEENLYQYEVERSADGKEFTKMAEQTPRNVATNHTYSWMDVRPNAGNNFYRIKALDNDGTFRYSATVKVNTGGAVQDVRVYPTTLDQPTVNLELTDQPAGIYEISMSNALGQMIFNKTLQHTGGNAVMTVDLSSYSLTAGVHFFTIKDQDGNKKSVKLMVKK